MSQPDSQPARNLRTPPRKEKNARDNGNKQQNGSTQGSKNKDGTSSGESRSARRRRKKREAAKRRQETDAADPGGGSPQKQGSSKTKRSPRKAKRQRRPQQKKEGNMKLAKEDEETIDQSRMANIEKVKSAAGEEQMRRIAETSRSKAQEEMIRVANVKSANRAANEEQQRRVEALRRVEVQEEMLRERNVKKAQESVERERDRRMSEDKRVATLEQLLRVSNQSSVKRQVAEERARRVQEDRESEKRVRRRSLSLKSGIEAGAAALQSGSPIVPKLSSKQSWQAPKTPKTKAAENLRERRLSMQGFPSLASMSAVEKVDSTTIGGTNDNEAINKKEESEGNETVAAVVPESKAGESNSMLDSAPTAPSDVRDDNAAENDDAAQKLANFKEFKALQKSANAAKAESNFKRALELYGDAVKKIRSFPANYHQERAEVLKRSAICFIAEKRYDEALESVRTAHREVVQMPNGAPTTELLRWNLTYQMVRGLQKKCKFSRSTNLAKSLVSEIKMRTEKADKDGKPWSGSEVKKAQALSTALKKAVVQNDTLAAKEKKSQGQYFDSKGSGFGKSGLFSDAKAKSTEKSQKNAHLGTVEADASKKPEADSSGERDLVLKETKQGSVHDASDDPDAGDDDRSFWLLTAGVAILVAGIAVFSVMRGK